MAFILIKGRFKPTAGIPDGDSVRFQVEISGLWKKLQGRPAKLGTSPKTKNTMQLRFEGIDAIEKKAVKPLSTQAIDNMFKLIGFDQARNPQPRGYILARMTDDKSGRPICFMFAGTINKKAGSEVFLDMPTLRKSVNFKQIEARFAYSLYYNTLFANLRGEFTRVHAAAEKNEWGTGVEKKLTVTKRYKE